MHIKFRVSQSIVSLRFTRAEQLELARFSLSEQELEESTAYSWMAPSSPVVHLQKVIAIDHICCEPYGTKWGAATSAEMLLCLEFLLIDNGKTSEMQPNLFNPLKLL